MNSYTVYPIGKVIICDEEFKIELEKKYIPALEGLDGFSHINIIWWFDKCDNTIMRSSLSEHLPYKNSPEILGTFATRSPIRPNAIALSCSEITYIDKENGIIGLVYTDADHGTPILDIKPYEPSLDRVEVPSVPAWCAHWPKSLEESAEFNWENEFNF